MHYILFYLVIITSITFQASNAQIIKTIDEIANHPNLKAGRWSVYAKNTVTGKIVAEYRSDKITAVALDKLGSDFQINTFIEFDGEIKPNGELTGNLFIRGEGDPTLGSTEMEGVLPYDTLFQVWVDKLKEKGITKIKGDIIADDSYLDYMPLPGGWAWDDMGNYYAAGTSGLCLNENMYHLFFKPANTVIMDLFTGRPGNMSINWRERFQLV